MKTVLRNLLLLVMAWAVASGADNSAPKPMPKFDDKEMVRITNVVEYARVYVEPKISALIAEGRSDETNLVSHLSAWIVKEPMDPAGEWLKIAHDDGIYLDLKKRADGKYDVEFCAGGDLASWTLQRTGSFEAGVLRLDRPVQQYAPFPPFRFFYLLRTPIGIRLVDQHAVRWWIIGQNIMTNKELWDRAPDYLDTKVFLEKTVTKKPKK
ncbi:MAG: hypothetical protein WA117_20150 [Verrucomicrobiia bacterium]